MYTIDIKKIVGKPVYYEIINLTSKVYKIVSLKIT